MTTTLRWIALFTASLAAAPALAGDGRIEINQACATQTGCGPGDGAGFPVTTQAGGSYLLTSDLTWTDPITGGVRVAAGVTLDLGGFTIQGPATCTGTPPACTNTGSGRGILGQGAGVTIRNGRVRGSAADGLSLSPGTGSLVENVISEGNGGDGFNVSGAGFQLLGCRALRNGGDGFFTAYQGSAAILLHGNAAHGNVGAGFDVSGALLLDNVASRNGARGLYAAYQDTDTAWGRNLFYDNNGGNTNSQATGGNQLGTNVCGTAACP